MAAILIAGCGYVGTALARRLAGHGHAVWGLRRNVSSLPAGVQPVAADLNEDIGTEALPSGLDAVVYTAAPDSGSDETYEQIYVSGLRRLLDAAASIAVPPKRLLLVSSTAVYAQTDGSWVDESSATAPTRYSGTRLLESEAVAHTSGMKATAVRFGGIYGPGRTSLIERVDRGDAAITPTPRYTNRIHRDDCAAVLEFLLRTGDPPATVVAVDEDPADANEVVAWLAHRLGLPSPSKSDEAHASRNKRCSSALLRSLGFVFSYPSYRDGYPTIVDEYLRTRES